MSLIIKGVDMPEKCDNCDLIQFDDEGLEAYCPLSPYYRWCGTPPDYRPEGCPLVEIPTPHGRLIDADELLKNHAVIADKEFIHLLYRGTLRKMINKAPTIIEAEVSKNA